MAEQMADSTYFRCDCCKARVEVDVLPQDAWIERHSITSQTPEFTYICYACRTKPETPRPSPTSYLCLGPCREVKWLPAGSAEAFRLQRDRAARIQRRNHNTPTYVGVCPECRHQMAIDRQTREVLAAQIERNSKDPAYQMARIRVLAGHFREEDALSIPEATARAVQIEMDVTEAARHPEFYAWLRTRDLAARGSVRIEEAEVWVNPSQEAAAA